MPPIAYFGIESSGLSLVIDLLILFLVIVYGSLVYWTYADARRRIADPILILCATAASLFPFVGTIVYMILRPPEYLEDVRERELDLQAAEARLHELEHSLCPHCDYRIERDFIRCPSCLRKLKERCGNCSRPLDRAWTICPYCETEVPSVKPARRARRESATGRASEPPSRLREESAQVGEPIELERPARRRSGAAAVLASEVSSLADTSAHEPAPGGAQARADLRVGAGRNGSAEPPDEPLAGAPAEPPTRRRSRPRAGD
jgi:Double zinc ribbon